MGSHGFYECVDMIGKHKNWTLNIITNLSYNPKRLLKTQLAKDGRLFVIASWHPLGCKNRKQAWKNFQKHLLMLKKAQVPTQVMYLWYKPQIKWFPKYFKWFDSNDFRVRLRRHVKTKHPIRTVLFRRILPRYFAGKTESAKYSPSELNLLRAFYGEKSRKYCLELASSYGMECSAGKDMILVEYDGTVKLCADCANRNHKLGNIFDPKFHLNTTNICCPTNTCGGTYGMLHLQAKEFEPPPTKLANDTFVSQAEHIPQTSPVAYPNRKEILKCLKKLQC